VGAGAFARGVLLPALARMADFRPTGVVTTSGLSALTAGRAGGFEYATTRFEDVLDDEETDAVVVATRHGEHAACALAALDAGKDVFLEKPLAIRPEELVELCRRVPESGRLLFVGFNRRFSPAAAEIRRRLRGRAGPLHMIYRVNAGALPAEHWTLDPAEGGGRVLGEVCHFVDLLGFFAGCPPVRVEGEALPDDGVTATIRYEDGSVGTVVYAVTGDTSIEKERIEIFGDGAAAVIDGFRRVTLATEGRARRLRVGPGKGHREELRAFLSAVRTGAPSPLPFSQAAWSTRATFAILESVSIGRPIDLEDSAGVTG
jgi:polar amino acid transport system substrate-binding protein